MRIAGFFGAKTHVIMELIINGIEYEAIPKKSTQHTGMSAYLSFMLGIYGGMFTSNKPKTKSLPTPNIIGEFELIQNKKSNLSRSEREMVIREFNRHFRVKEIEV